VTDAPVEWEPPEDFDPVAALMEGLRKAHDGEPVDEVPIQYATMMIACGTLMQGGLDFDTACDVVCQAMTKGDIHVLWTREDGLSVTVGGPSE